MPLVRVTKSDSLTSGEVIRGFSDWSIVTGTGAGVGAGEGDGAGLGTGEGIEGGVVHPATKITTILNRTIPTDNLVLIMLTSFSAAFCII